MQVPPLVMCRTLPVKQTPRSSVPWITSQLFLLGTNQEHTPPLPELHSKIALWEKQQKQRSSERYWKWTGAKFSGKRHLWKKNELLCGGEWKNIKSFDYKLWTHSLRNSSSGEAFQYLQQDWKSCGEVRSWHGWDFNFGWLYSEWTALQSCSLTLECPNKQWGYPYHSLKLYKT